MNKTVRKLTACGLSVALCLTGVGVAFAQGAEKTKDTQSDTTVTVQNESTQEISKDETVYVLAGADGSVKKIIVSDWIKNTLGSDKISDKSNLSNIKNVKGNESYTLNGDNMTVWDTEGNDIYYQGNIEKELPVNISVSYRLDGKSVSAEEIAGKSGKVAIRFDYQNNQYETVNIDGKEEKIYVPFAMLTGMMLDNATFRNVEVSNGKLLNDGDHTVVVGLAFPSMQENMAISRETLEIPDYVEIIADATDFKLGMTVTVATNEIFNKINTDDISTSNIDTSLAELTDAVTQLTDGSSALYGGLCTLLEKSDVLAAGVKEIADGAKALKEGANDLSNGTDKLLQGAQKLSSGLDTLSANSADLNGGAAQVFDTLLSTATAQINAAGITIPNLTVDNYADVLNAIESSLNADTVYNQALREVTAAVEAQRDNITLQVAQQVLASAVGMTLDEYQAAVNGGMINEQQQAQLQAAIDQNVETQIAAAIESNMQSETVQARLSAAADGKETVAQLKKSLDSYNNFYLGVCTYTAGVDEAASGAENLSDGASDLKDGASKLKAGVDKLYDGVLSLQDGMPTLISGVTELHDGSKELSDGVKKFNEKGIQKLTNLVDGDLKNTAVRLRATVDVSKDYTNFSGIGDGIDGQVKFIYRTEEID